MSSPKRVLHIQMRRRHRVRRVADEYRQDDDGVGVPSLCMVPELRAGILVLDADPITARMQRVYSKN